MTNNEEVSAIKLAETAIYHGAVQKIKELTDCVELIQERSVPERILEIGTASGGTFWLWCQLATQTGHIVSLDLPMARFSSDKSYNKGLLKSYSKPNQQLSFIKRNSHTDKAELQVQKVLDSSLLDLLFIDGDHTYKGVKEDYERYSKYVRHGGLIVFHDIVHHNQVPECQVDQFWNELKKGKQFYEFIDPEPDDRGWGSWGGLGVIVKD